MLRLDKVIKPWKEAAALNDHINLYGFWNETVFLTKSGDVGNEQTPPVVVTKPAADTKESAQTAFPFGTGI